MGDMDELQDAIATSGLVPPSCVPTFAELDTWTTDDVMQVRAWLAGGGRGPTPAVFHAAIARYHAPRGHSTATNPDFHGRIDHEEMMAGENFVAIDRDWRMA